ncbi:DNA polymerase III subunit gamma/tau [bacterium]|nr:DNA polymerase III subunit gamma/tau [bacterium]
MNEKYVPLYRKYRPQTLEELVGQEHIKNALKNAIKLNKIAHAYLFTGPRGTGKTSSARILAKSLNCENGPTVKPCGKCESCTDIINSTPVDVIEIDAASNRKVEDAQNILEKIQYVPVNGKYKIYIIDEVHMLSNTAFNALLKTLEEPPENVIFILATTEPQKVLDTIKSRCQRYDFKRITTEDIVKHLEYISEKENINIEKDALYAIAKNAEGGMRDSISLLDQLSVLGTTQSITVDDINSLLGRISFDILAEISKTIVESKPQNAIELLEKIYNSGNEPSQILLNLLEFFKNALLIKTCEKNTAIELTQYNDEQIKIVNQLVENLEKHQIIFLTEKISNYIKEVKTSTTPRLWLEISLIDLANLTENTTLLDLQERITKLESGETKQISVTPVYKTAPSPSMKPIMKPVSVTNQNKTENIQKDFEKQDILQPQQSLNNTKIEETSEISNKTENINTKTEHTENDDFSPMPKSQPQEQSQTISLSELWHTLISNIQSSPTQALLKLAKPVMITPEQVIITFAKESFVENANGVSKKQAIKDACDIMFGQKNTNVTIRLPHPDDNKLIDSASEIEKKNIEYTPQQKNLDSTKRPDVNTNTTSDVETSNEQSKENPYKQNPDENTTARNRNKDANKEEISDKPKELNEQNQTETPSAPVDKSLISDQVKMIMTLFDGKEII